MRLLDDALRHRRGTALLFPGAPSPSSASLLWPSWGSAFPGESGPDGAHEIELLPALPSTWSAGSVRGLRARGGFEVDLSWKAGVPVAAAVKSPRGRACRLRLRDKVVEVKLTPGQTVEVDANLGRVGRPHPP